MFRLRHSIKIEQQDLYDAGGNLQQARSRVYVMPSVNNISIETSYTQQTQKAEITLPKSANLPSGENIYSGVLPLLLRGDKVTIYGGYYPNMPILFEGYISKVDSQIPVTISCEDEMYRLKQEIAPNITLSASESTLKKVLEDAQISTKYETEAIDAKLGKFRVTKKVTKAFVLQSLKSIYGMYSYFRGTKLYSGLASWGTGKEVEILFERDIIENNLTFLRADDVRIQIKGVLINSDNTREEIELGDKDGDLRTVFHYGGTIADLRKTCERFLQQARYTGYHGSFTTFLEPSMVFGDVVSLKSYKEPERNGKYLIKSVSTEIGVNGGRQNIELERVVSSATEEQI